MKLFQQTDRDLMLQMNAQHCSDLLHALEESAGATRIAGVEVHASALRVRSPRVMPMTLVPGEADELRKEGDALVWSMEPDTVDGFVEKLKAAVGVGYFSPAELMIVAGPRGSWLRLYAEIVR